MESSDAVKGEGPGTAFVRPNTGAAGYDDHETSLVAGRLRAVTTRSGLGIVHQGLKNGFSESRTKSGSAHFGLTVWLKLPEVAEGGVGARPARLMTTRNAISISPAGYETLLRVPDGGHEILHLSIATAQIAHALDPDDLAGAGPFGLAPRAMVADPVAHHLVRKLAGEAFAGGQAAATLIDGLFLELMVHLLRLHGATPIASASRGGLSDAAARHVAAFVDANLAQPIGLAELAAVAGYSPYHFSRLFKTHFNLTPHAYVVHRRLERAKLMLRARHASLSDIAFACGFSSQQQFTTAFARAYGAPPGRWRASTL